MFLGEVPDIYYHFYSRSRWQLVCSVRLRRPPFNLYAATMLKSLVPNSLPTQPLCWHVADWVPRSQHLPPPPSNSSILPLHLPLFSLIRARELGESIIIIQLFISCIQLSILLGLVPDIYNLFHSIVHQIEWWIPILSGLVPEIYYYFYPLFQSFSVVFSYVNIYFIFYSTVHQFIWKMYCLFLNNRSIIWSFQYSFNSRQSQ